MSFDPDLERARQDTHYWGALALSPEEKTGVEDPIEMQRRADALPVERTASRWIVSSDPRRARRARTRISRPRLPPPGLPRARRRTRSASSSCTASRSCPACAEPPAQADADGLGGRGRTRTHSLELSVTVPLMLNRSPEHV